MFMLFLFTFRVRTLFLLTFLLLYLTFKINFVKTIKEIAEIAQVSTGTIDRVIHNRKGVSEKTKLKVLKTLSENGFERNMIASTLASKKKYTISTLIPYSNSPSDFWALPKQGIINAISSIKDYGFSVHQFFFNQFEENTYLEKFNELIDSKPDAALIAPIFYKQTVDLVRKLEEYKIPYLFINIDLKGLKNISFIGQNSYQGGLLAGKLMNLLVENTSEILIVKKKREMDNHSAIYYRVSGFKDYYKQNKHTVKIHQIEILSKNKNLLKSNYLTKTLLKNHKIKGIFVPSSFVNIVANYLNEYELNEIKLIGYDINKTSETFVKNERINFLITQKPFEQGYKGIKVLADYLLLGKEPKLIYYSPIEIITKENIDFYSS